MFALDPIHPLFSATVEIIAKKPGTTVKDLHQELKKQKEKITLTHLYRVVNRMIDAQIIIKDGTSLTLNSMWLGQLSLFAESAQKKLQKGELQESIIPLKEGQRVSLKAESLQQLQALWYSVLVQVHREIGHEEREVCKYYSHAWWMTRGGPESEAFYKRIAEKDIQCFWLYGNDNLLNREAAKKYKSIFESKIVDRPPFPEEGYCINIHGDYILECVFPENIASHFALLFRGTKSVKEFDASLIEDLFHMKASYTLKLWRNAKMAKQLTGKIRKFFRVTSYE